MSYSKKIDTIIKNKLILPKTSISMLDLTVFFRQLATLISSSISIVQSLEILLQIQQNPLLKKIILEIKNTTEQGRYLSSGLRKFPKYFDEITCHMLAMGEVSGTFPWVLEQLALHKEKSYALRQALKKSLFYPGVLCLTAIVTFLVLLLFIVPRFCHLFEETGIALPAFTLAVINLSSILRHYFYVPLFFLVLYFILDKNESSLSGMKQRTKAVLCKIRIINTLYNKILLVDFTRYLSVTIRAGLTVSEAIPFIAKACGDIYFEHALLQLQKKIEHGNKIHNAMRDTTSFPNLLIEMVRVGEESGTLDYMLEKISNIYENELNQLTTYLSQLLEPLIMLILGVLIGGLVIAMYLPIFKLGTLL